MKQNDTGLQFTAPYDCVIKQSCPASCIKNCALRSQLKKLTDRVFEHGNGIYVQNFFYSFLDPYCASEQKGLNTLLHEFCDNCNKGQPNEKEQETVIYGYTPYADESLQVKPYNRCTVEKMGKLPDSVKFGNTLLIKRELFNKYVDMAR